MLVVAFAIGAVAFADVVNLVAAHDQAIVAAQAETANLSRSLADQARGTIETLDTVLLGMRERVETDGTAPARLESLPNLLRLHTQALPLIHRLLVADAGGRVLVTSGATAAASDTIQAMRIFVRHAASRGRGLLVGWPVRDPMDGNWVITLSRRMDHPDGSFAGVVVVSIGTASLRQAYARFDTGRAGIILLTRADGVNIARWPADPRGEAADVSSSDLFTRIVGPGDREHFENFSQVDRLERLASYHWVQGAPVLLMVGRSRQDVLAGWRRTAFAHVLGLSVVAGVLVALGRRLARKIGEEERAQQVLRATNHRLAASEASTAQANGWLEMAEQIAQVGHWHADLEGGAPAVFWSDEIYRIYGVDRARFATTPDSALGAFHPQDRAAVLAVVKAAIRTGTPYEFNARLMRPDGSERHVFSRGLPHAGADGRTVALFGVIMDTTEQKRNEAALREAHAEAEAANHALEAANHALEAMAMQDALTGLANRRHFDKALDREFSRAARAQLPLALVMIDVDQFKGFNDLYGHQAGDACLRAIAGVISPLLSRPGDTAARYGGEELAVLLPGNTEGGALAMAHRIGGAVRALAIPHAGSPHGVVTVTLGTEAFVPMHGPMRVSELVEHADMALYAAKRAGRDCVFAYQDLAVLAQ